MEHKTYDIYYDEDGDFLEVLMGEPPENEYTEQEESGIFITKNADTNELRAIGILNFKKRCHILNEILKKMNVHFPLKIDCSK
jgi:hypothetical protein